MRLEEIDWRELPDAIRDTARFSAPNVAIYDPEIIGYVGLIPPTFLSNEAYLWLHLVAPVRKVAFGRAARRFMRYARGQYPLICGHCIDDSSRRWLRSLGANFISHDTFEIIS